MLYIMPDRGREPSPLRHDPGRSAGRPPEHPAGTIRLRRGGTTAPVYPFCSNINHWLILLQ